MKENTLKKCLIATGLVAALGLASLAVKFVEYFLREAHDWAKPFLICGIVFLSIALVMLIGTVVLANIIEKKNINNPKQSDEEILAKYRSKRN